MGGKFLNISFINMLITLEDLFGILILILQGYNSTTTSQLMFSNIILRLKQEVTLSQETVS